MMPTEPPFGRALVAGLALIAVAFIAAPGILLSRMCG